MMKHSVKPIQNTSAKRVNGLKAAGACRQMFGAPMLLVLFLITGNPFSSGAQTSNKEPVPRQAGAGKQLHEAPDCKALLRAVREKDKAKVAALLKTVAPDCTYRGDGEPRSPLVAAAREGDLEITKLLLGAGADVEYHAQGDESPLMAASANGRLNVVSLLVARGAEVNREVVGDGTALLVASRGGQVAVVNYLISQGADVDGQVNADGTPLINAVRNGHYEVAKILLENGANPTLASEGDEYPLYHARNANNKAMVELLKKYEKKSDQE